jgi:arylamine N-acetyltransferase
MSRRCSCATMTASYLSESLGGLEEERMADTILGREEVQRLPDDWVTRYLQMLGVTAEAPSGAALGHLTRRHLLSVPFGNVTALLRYQAYRGKDLPALDFDDLLRQWERGHGSGVCFEIAWAFSLLLSELGYEVWPVPGLIGSFMGGHQALVVFVEEKRYLVDVGCGSPLFEPIPLDETVEVEHAGLFYRLRSGDTPNVHLQELRIAGEWSTFCRYEIRDQSPAEREAAYRRHHSPRESFVVGELRLVRCTEAGVDSLHQDRLTRYSADGKSTEHLFEHADYIRVAREVFRLPALPIVNAVLVLEGLDDGAARASVGVA